MSITLSFIIGLFLRLGIPLIVSAVIFFLLRRLDQRWQKEALAIPVISNQRPCWELKGCREENRKNCLAAAHPNTPCWQTFRSKNGLLQEKCLGCDVFRLAPVPVIS